MNLPYIPGIRDKTKATIISRISNIERSVSKEKFVHYIILDQVMHQSSKSTKHKRISKKGIRY